MSLDSLAQLQELALTDAALRQALDAVSSSADLLGLASLHNLELSESSAQAWLQSRLGQAPSAEILASISQGLSASDEDETALELTEDDLAGIAGGGMMGEAVASTSILGEAL
ncbi:MAG: Nif11 family protein [Synechococcaceae cyanobacterium ELA182]